MKKNFIKAKKIVRAEFGKIEIIAINGCMYGRDNQPYKSGYRKICGQPFWELVSGDNDLYKKIIQPLDKEAKKRDEIFKCLYAKKINEMTKGVVKLFYSKNDLDWNKIVEYVSKK